MKLSDRKTLLPLFMLAVSITGCRSPCKDAIDDVESRVRRFIADADPLTPGPQPCGIDPDAPSYDQICDYAVKALSTRWPYHDCSSCDALELKLCSCFGEEIWATSGEGKPIYPGLVTCLASVYRLRSLCECDPGAATVSGGVQSCYKGEERQCKVPESPLVKMPTQQQSDSCNVQIDSFICSSQDRDRDGIPDQYDGGQAQTQASRPEPPTCLDGPPGEAGWHQWRMAPISLYQGGHMFVNAGGGARDKDADGVSDLCDNCPDNPNGFDCAKEINGESPFLKLCDVDQNGTITADELKRGSQRDCNGNGVGDACDPKPCSS